MKKSTEDFGELLKAVVAKCSFLGPLSENISHVKKPNHSWDNLAVSQLDSSGFACSVLTFYNLPKHKGFELPQDQIRELTNILAGTIRQIMVRSGLDGATLTIPCQTFAGLVALLDLETRYENLLSIGYQGDDFDFCVKVFFRGSVSMFESSLEHVYRELVSGKRIESL